MKDKKENKVAVGFRLRPEIIELIEAGAAAAGVSQSEFVDRCVLENIDRIVEKSDDERKKARESLAELRKRKTPNPAYSDSMLTNSSRQNPLEIAAKRLAESFSGSEPKSKASR